MVLLWSAEGAAAVGPAADEGLRRLTIEDELSIEDYGGVVIAPDNSLVVYEHQPPYERAPNLSALSITNDKAPLYKLVQSRTDDRLGPAPLFDQEEEGGYWFGGPSPDGSKLAIYSLRNGLVRAGVFDFKSHSARWFPFTPNYFWFQQRAVWISNRELVYTILPGQEQPAIVFRSQLADRISRLWQKTFAGKEPSNTVIVSTAAGLSEVDAFRPGAVVRVDVASGRTTEMGSGFVYNFRLSPDGKYLAGLREAGALQWRAEEDASDWDRKRKQIVVYDLVRGGEGRMPCSACNVSMGTLEWSADSKRLTFFGRPAGAEVREGRYYEYEPENDAMRPVMAMRVALTCNPFYAHPMRAISVDGQVALYGRRSSNRTDGFATVSSGGCNDEATDRSDWFLVDKRGRARNVTEGFASVSSTPVGKTATSLFLLADGDVWEIRGRSRRNVTGKLHLSPLSSFAESEGVKFSLESAYMGEPIPVREAHLASKDDIVIVDLERGTVRKVIPRPQTDAVLLGLSRDADLAVFRQDEGYVSTLTLVDPIQTRVLEVGNRAMRSIALPRQLTLNYSVSGKSLSSCVLLPDDSREQRPDPLVVVVYPELASGRCMQFPPADFDPYSPRLLTAHGYAVLFAAAPREFIRTSDGPTQGLTPTVLAAVDAAVKAGYADGTRVGIFGFSQGYHSALQILTQTHRFKAAVAVNGIADFASQYGAIPLFTRMFSESFDVGDFARFELRRSQNWLGQKPWTDPELYVGNSPLFSADKIDTPVLIINSDFDQFPIGQSEEMFSALYRQRKEATYVTYWGEGHANLSPANIRDFWKRVLAWYDQRLQ